MEQKRLHNSQIFRRLPYIYAMVQLFFFHCLDKYECCLQHIVAHYNVRPLDQYFPSKNSVLFVEYLNWLPSRQGLTQQTACAMVDAWEPLPLK